MSIEKIKNLLMSISTIFTIIFLAWHPTTEIGKNINAVLVISVLVMMAVVFGIMIKSRIKQKN